MDSAKIERAAKVRRPNSRTMLFVTHARGYGGTEKHLLELLSRLGDGGVRIVILCLYADPYSERLNFRSNSEIEVRQEANLNTWKDWYRVFRSIKPDVVVFVYGWIWCLPPVAALGARLAGIRRRFAIYHLIPPVPFKIEGKSLRDRVRRIIGRRARHRWSLAVQPRLFHKTICVSNAVRDALVRDYRFPRRKTATIHNGVSMTDFAPSRAPGATIRAKLGLRADDFVLISTARLSEEKGIDIVLRAMGELWRTQLPCKLIMVGEGHLKDELTAQVQSLGLSDHVFMVGFQDDVKQYLMAGDAFVLTSYREGLPFAILEAMACGLPSIVSNVGGNAEAVAHNVNGIVVNPGSVDEVVEAISYFITHPEERSRMSQVARSRACNEFDIEAKMQELKQVLLS